MNPNIPNQDTVCWASEKVATPSSFPTTEDVIYRFDRDHLPSHVIAPSSFPVIPMTGCGDAKITKSDFLSDQDNEGWYHSRLAIATELHRELKSIHDSIVSSLRLEQDCMESRYQKEFERCSKRITSDEEKYTNLYSELRAQRGKNEILSKANEALTKKVWRKFKKHA